MSGPAIRRANLAEAAKLAQRALALVMTVMPHAVTPVDRSNMLLIAERLHEAADMAHEESEWEPPK